MPRDGSGNYSLPSASFVEGTDVLPAPVNANFSDIASELTASLTRAETTTFSRSLLDDASSTAALTTLGASAAGSSLITAADADAQRALLGIDSHKIASYAVPSGGISSVGFALPTPFTWFKLRYGIRANTGAIINMALRASTDGGATFKQAAGDYAFGYIIPSGASAVERGQVTNASQIDICTGAGESFGNEGTIYIRNANVAFPAFTVSARSGVLRAPDSWGPQGFDGAVKVGGTHNFILIFPVGGIFAQGSTFTLYAVRS